MAHILRRFGVMSESKFNAEEREFIEGELLPFVCEHPENSAYRIAELQAEVERLRALHEPMLRFVLGATDIAWEGCDYEGITIQDDLHRFGLFDMRVMDEPCGEICACADLALGFPTECYRLTPALIEARDALQERSDA
jgi:hypothetical protein